MKETRSLTDEGDREIREQSVFRSLRLAAWFPLWRSARPQLLPEGLVLRADSGPASTQRNDHADASTQS